VRGFFHKEEKHAFEAMPEVHILGISGSSRKGSFNTALLEACKELLPENATLETFDISGFPIFNRDLEKTPPPDVEKFKEKVRAADAILFATPEFNFSIPALLKNAIEWGNRGGGHNVWSGKPAAMISASDGPRGGARAQLHLRQIMVDLNIHPINTPQVYLARAQDAFDSNLKLVDEKYRKNLGRLLRALVDWAVRIGGGELRLS
jgi:chromate reductase